MSRWADAAFEQERLLGSIKHNPNFRIYMENFQEEWFKEVPDGLLLRINEQTLQEADPMYVSMEVVELLDRARQSFKPEPLHPWDLPCQVSFVLLPRPMEIKNSYGHNVRFRAISWAPVSKNNEQWSSDNHPAGVWITMWSHLNDPDDYNRHLRDVPEREAWEMIGDWSVLHTGLMDFGDDAYAFEKIGRVDAITTEDEGERNQVKSRLETWLLLQSFWRLSRQIVPAREKLPRQLRRERLRKDRTDDVTVITLRRAVSDLPEHESVRTVGEDFHYINHGGWRSHYYPSMGPCYLDDGTPNPHSHRQIYILPFLKGNLDAPLKTGKRVFEFTR